MKIFENGERLLVNVPAYVVTATNGGLYVAEPVVTMTQILDFERAGYVIVNRFPTGPNNMWMTYDLRRAA